MKKKLLALAALATVAGVAQAQSTVTIYGLIDAGVAYTNNGISASNASANQLTAANGILATSRFGLRGAEDLGGGLSATFNLEAGLNPQTGAQSRSVALFDRRANVGFNGNFGTLTMGRETNVGWDYAAAGITDPLSLAYDGYANTIASSSAGKFGSSQKLNAVITVVANTTGGTTRNDGTLKYVTPNFNGFQAALAYHPGGVADSNKNSAWSAGLKGTIGPVTAAYAHWEAKDALSIKAKYDSVGATATAAGVKFTAGYHNLRAEAGYGRLQADGVTAATSAPNLTTEAWANLPGVTASNSGEYKVYTVGASYDFTPAFRSTLAFNQGDVVSAGTSLGKLNNTVWQNQYFLSKRTQAYGTLAYSKVDSGVAKTANVTDATVFIVGILHNF